MLLLVMLCIPSSKKQNYLFLLFVGFLVGYSVRLPLSLHYIYARYSRVTIKSRVVRFVEFM